MAQSAKARIIGLGSCLPEQVLSNSDLERMVDTSDEWIVSRTGMKERRIANADETPATLGKIAAERALKEADLAVDQIEMILVATSVPDYLMPSTAALIQGRLGAVHAAAMDLQAVCSGFIYALSMAKAYIEAGIYRYILIVAAEKLSSVIDYTDRSTCILFGDGASAAVVGHAGQGLMIDTVRLGADGTQAELIIVPAGGARCPATAETVANRQHYFRMQGNEVFKHAVRRMETAAERCLQEAGLQREQITWLIPHQANMRIMEVIAKRFDLPLEKVWKTVHKYGNIGAASVAVSLEELVHEQQIIPGDHLLLVAFGSGLTWGAAILTQVSK